MLWYQLEFEFGFEIKFRFRFKFEFGFGVAVNCPNSNGGRPVWGLNPQIGVKSFVGLLIECCD